ncbi:hypothetical protein PXC01_17465, partial [Maribacter sp. M208]|uniref:hypothetical protein n=1 Tax=Maribacter huludaoensis TaxID=3030010 RepID=UPI003B839B23|nr:hypothetical protein [Maribacter huludaoensis]
MTNEILKVELNIKSMKSQTTTTLSKSIKGLMVLFTLLLSAISIAQTTVTLEDQCNCEVLQGTDVSAPGAVTPAGADLGDLYVNTDTGTIYYWNGTTWELTSTDDNTTNASLTEDGVNLVLTDSDLNTVSIPLADIAAAVDTNTTNVNFTVNSTNGTLDIIDSDGNVVSVPLADIAALTDTDTQYTAGSGLDLNSNEFSIAADAVTNDKLADDAVQTENIVNGTILTEDIASGGNDQILVTDATGAVEWIDKSTFDAIADQVTITGLGTSTDPFKVEDLAIVTDK